jgi:RNA polymerase sigma-70 factor (ECF subfamily)
MERRSVKTAGVGTVAGVETVPHGSVPVESATPLDAGSQKWLRELRGTGAVHDAAVTRLHELLLGAARFEVTRRRPLLGHVRADELDDLALQAADDALMSVLAHLDDFRGLSRFTTWAYKFGLYEAATKLRRRSWQERELPLEPESWELFSSSVPTPQREAEQRELLDSVTRAIDEVLTPHQRKVLVALALNGVPIDVLADRFGTTRGALYKTLHDARGKLRRHLAAAGLMTETTLKEL